MITRRLLLLALGVRSLGKAFHRVGEFDRWARNGTGTLFIGIGIYLSLTHVFGLSW